MPHITLNSDEPGIRGLLRYRQETGRPISELASAKAMALLPYLAVTGTGQSRSALAGLLWSDLPEPTARANLRLVLTKLRRALPGHLAVTRQKVDGTPPGGWFPGQRMSREEALRSWTIEGAYAAFDEDRKGSLEPGKMADFVMLSGDIMTMPTAEIPRTRITMTVAGGKIVFEQ